MSFNVTFSNDYKKIGISSGSSSNSILKKRKVSLSRKTSTGTPYKTRELSEAPNGYLLSCDSLVYIEGTFSDDFLGPRSSSD